LANIFLLTDMIEYILGLVWFWVMVFLWAILGLSIEYEYGRRPYGCPPYNKKQKAFVMFISGPAIWCCEIGSIIKGLGKGGIEAALKKLK